MIYLLIWTFMMFVTFDTLSANFWSKLFCSTICIISFNYRKGKLWWRARKVCSQLALLVVKSCPRVRWVVVVPKVNNYSSSNYFLSGWPGLSCGSAGIQVMIYCREWKKYFTQAATFYGLWPQGVGCQTWNATNQGGGVFAFSLRQTSPLWMDRVYGARWV